MTGWKPIPRFCPSLREHPMTTQTHPISPSQRKQALVIFLIIAVVLIAIPTYFTGVELTYSLIGVTTTAQVTGNHRENRSAGKSGGRRPVFVIDYTFQESGGLQRIERDVIPEDLPFSASGPVTVEYIPGFHRVSRIQGHRAKLLHFWLFFGTGGTLCGVMAWLAGWHRLARFGAYRCASGTRGLIASHLC